MSFDKIMLGQIKFDTYEKCYPKRLKGWFRKGINYKTYDIIRNVGGGAIVGNIPPELIRMLPKENRGRDIKDIQRALAEITNYLRAQYHALKFKPGISIYDENYKNSPLLKELEEKATLLLSGRLRKHNISAELQFAGHGTFANVFRLSIKNKDGKKIMYDKALKVYHQVNELDANFRAEHNTYAEANFWTYFSHVAGRKLDDTQFTKHYISDLKSGYCMTEFIGPELPRPKKFLDIVTVFGLNLKDARNNRPIFERIYDVGGIVKDSNFIDDNVVLKYFRKLFSRTKKELPEYIAHLEKLAQNPKTPLRDKIQKALDLYDKLPAYLSSNKQ